MHCVLQRADDRGKVFLCRLFRAGLIENQAAASRSGDSAREHGARCDFETFNPHRNGNCTDFAVEKGKRCLRRYIARGKPGAAGGDNQTDMALVGAVDQRFADFFLFIRDNGGVDDGKAAPSSIAQTAGPLVSMRFP